MRKDFLGRFSCIVSVLSSSLGLFPATSYPGCMAVSSLVGGDGEPLLWDDEEGFHPAVPAVCSCIFKSLGFSNDQKLISSWSQPILQQFHL